MLLALLLLGSLATLPSLAHLSPPDPVWLAGLYDEGDHDDIVATIISTDAALALAAPAPLPLLIVLAVFALSRQRDAPSRPVPALQTRSPPAL